MTILRSTEIATKLSSAMAERRLVRISTRYDDSVVTGYVMSLGPGFVMVAVVSDRVWLDGFECFRRPDVIDIEDHPYSAFIETALARRGEILPNPPAVSLTSIEELLKAAGEAYPLVTIHCEEVDPEVCYIGSVHSIVDGCLLMHEVTPAAEWVTEFERHMTTDITRVSFGADYEEALWLVAETPPQI